MTDPFTAACPLYRAAVAQPHKTGAALQVTRGPWFRLPWSRK